MARSFQKVTLMLYTLVALGISLGLAWFVCVWALADQANLYSRTIGWILFAIGAVTATGAVIGYVVEDWSDDEGAG